MTFPSIEADPGGALAAALSALRERAPLVQCITNYVAMTPNANTLLAAGAAPAMIHAPEEAGDFAAVASALVVNIGTLSAEWVEGMRAAVAAARAGGKPWALDPVGYGATPYRTGVADALAALSPTLIRGNASEILGLSGASASGRGVDAGDAVEAAAEGARTLARRTGGVVAASGAVDYVTDEKRGAWIENGAPLMPKVTALGCSLTALCGGFLGAGVPPFEATVAGFAAFGLAGERAADGLAGPGRLLERLLDALYVMTPEDLAASARVRLE